VVGVGKVNSCRVHIVELLTLARHGVGQVDDLEDLWAPEAGDLDSAHRVRLGVAVPVCREELRRTCSVACSRASMSSAVVVRVEN
jgi:hypothetical protein